MRILALLLLVANVLFFTWRFNAQIEDEVAARRRSPPLPAHAPSLTLLRELPALPPERAAEVADEPAAMPVPAPPDTVGEAVTSPATEQAQTPVAPAVGVAAAAPGTDLSTAGEQGTDPASNASPVPSASDASAGTTAEVAPGETSGASPSVSSTETPGPATPEASPPVPASDTAVALTSPAAVAEAVPTPDAPVASPPEVAMSAAAEGVPATTVAIDTANPSADTAPATTPVASPRVPSGVCLRAGPFQRDVDVDPLKTWLMARSSSLVVKREGGTQKPLFGIYLEPRTADEKEANLRDLAKRGVRDYLPVKRDGMAHAISLGVFSTQENVNRRLAEIEKQGYRAIVVPRRDAGGERYIEAELDSGYEDPADIPGKLIGNATLTTRPCTP